MGYIIEFNGGKISTNSVSMTTTCEYDSSLRPTPATTVISLKNISINKVVTAAGKTFWSLPNYDLGTQGLFTLGYQADKDDPDSYVSIINGTAKITTATNDNSKDPASTSVINNITEFTIYHSNDIFPGNTSIQNVSSLSYKFEISIGDDHGTYAAPNAIGTGPQYLLPTDSSEGSSTVYKVNISAVGRNSDLGYAQTAINLIEGFDDIPTRLNLGNTYDKTTSTSTDSAAGSIDKTITYTAYDSTAVYRDSYNANITTDNRNMDFYTTITIDGSIQGLNTSHGDLSDDRATNAETGLTNTLLTIYDRAKKALPGINPLPISKKYDRQPQGIIKYSHTYDTRPVSLVSGAFSEDLVMSDEYQTRELSHLPILGGVSLQNFGTYTIPSRTVSYTAQFLRGYSIPSQIYTMIDNAIDQFDPTKLSSSTDSAIVSHVESDESSYDRNSNKITQTKKWIYYIR